MGLQVIFAGIHIAVRSVHSCPTVNFQWEAAVKRIACLLVVSLLVGCGGGGGGGDSGGVNTPQGSGGTPIPSVAATTSITQNGAVLNGNVTPNGLDTQAWFEHGTDPNLSTYTSTPEQAIGQGLSAVPVNQSISGCAGGTTYYYRVCGRNAKGSTKSTITGFTTSSPGAAPVVITLAATSLGATAATLNGNVTPNGLATNAWFEYGTDPSLASPISTSTQAVGAGTINQPVNAAVTGLSTGTTYYYRVAAGNSSGTTKGSIASFKPAAIATRDVVLSWAPNRESGVNSAGGGYQVSISGQPAINVPYTSGPTAPTTTTVALQAGTYTVTVKAYAALDAQGGSGGNLSAPSAPITVNVP